MKNIFLILLYTTTIMSSANSAELNDDLKEWVRPKEIPYPKDNPITKDKVALGKKLFFDPILSRANNIACSSCHDPVKGWSDADEVAIGDQGRKGTRNSPTILNSAYQYVYFWDGRAKSLEEQALGPIKAHVEMNLDPKEAVRKLQKNEEYQKQFKKVFPDEGITVKTLAQAIATFERTIVSGESRFDKWIEGDATKLNDDELEGFALFLDKADCVICHRGFNFTDNSFYNIGIDNGDIGREAVKKRAFWHGAFKTPTLRNIENSAPYFHDGSVKTLEEAVEICAKGGRDKNATNKSEMLRDKNLTKDEIMKIVSFLKTLSEPVPDL